jgi:phosphatidylinositol glycan class B
MVFGFVLWMWLIQKEKFPRLFYLFAGIIFAVLCGNLIDYWFYGNWTFTAWNYFEQNMILGKAASFGIEPWYYYLREILFNAIPPFSLAFLIAPFLYFYFRPKDSITWLLVPFILVHFIVGHKELRFMFVVISFLPLLLVITYEIIQSRFEKQWQKKLLNLFTKGFWLTNIILVIVVMFKPADSHISLYRTIYDNYTDKTQLYYIGKNPYQRVEDVHFYKRNSLKIAPLDSLNQLNNKVNSKTTLVVTNQSNLLPQLQNWGKQIYSSFPEWIRQFNFNNWMDRTNIWYVYQINQIE